jgi:hypothetical protein
MSFDMGIAMYILLDQGARIPLRCVTGHGVPLCLQQAQLGSGDRWPFQHRKNLLHQALLFVPVAEARPAHRARVPSEQFLAAGPLR